MITIRLTTPAWLVVPSRGFVCSEVHLCFCRTCRRAIDLHEGDEVDGDAFKTLIRAAVALNRSQQAEDMTAPTIKRNAAKKPLISGRRPDMSMPYEGLADLRDRRFGRTDRQRLESNVRRRNPRARPMGGAEVKRRKIERL
jgi:hypothetical protein